MNRCVAIHSNGTSEVLEVAPKLHQELRGLGYRRFVVRTADNRSLSSAVYARRMPSNWQFADAARKLWGLSSEVRVFDEQGELIVDAGTPASGVAVVAETPVRLAPPVDERRHAHTSEPQPTASLVTQEMLADLRRAAHEVRLNLGDWLYGGGDGTEQRAFVDRLDMHVRALESAAAGRGPRGSAATA